MRPPAATHRRAHPGKVVRTRAIRSTIPATPTRRLAIRANANSGQDDNEYKGGVS